MPSGILSLAELKRQARADALLRRRRNHADDRATDAEAVARRVLDSGAIAPADTVAGFWPIGEEIDVRPLLDALAARGHALLLPVVEKRGAPLLFRAWRAGDPLEGGPLGTRQPCADRPAGVPDVMIVPILAFDEAGYRLGYGGGFYDRTIAALRPGGALAVGVAYEDQCVAAVPRDDTDMRLDWIVTERQVRRIGALVGGADA